ncbi:hypothetical protein DFH06DRAFT_1097654 [Mycena polygramma]|nr:hypothetical protein DFH06DRAFT_1097654 [Mycena polygramma]
MSNQIDGLWFSSDQLVALRAGESIFRVPKSILAARSSVFQAMFEFPQPAVSDGEMTDGDEFIDGSPVVHLHDSPTEVEPFLRAIFDSRQVSHYFMPPPAHIGFLQVLGILRLSHKYDVGYLHKRALCHLETVYPVQLKEVGSLTKNNTLGYDESANDLDLTAIPVLHEVGATWLLPCAYYSLAGFDVESLVSAGETWDRLPPTMKQTCILAQARHIEASHKILAAMTPPSKCASRDACDAAKFRFLKRHDVSNAANLIPLYDWQSNVNGICGDCSRRGQAQYHEMRGTIWNQLPQNCGMENWDVLTEKRRLTLEL